MPTSANHFDEETQETDLRADLMAAMEQAEREDTPGEGEETPAPEQPPEGEPPPEVEPPEGEERARDEQGRFAKGKKKAATEGEGHGASEPEVAAQGKPAAGQPAAGKPASAPAPGAPGAPEDRAPQSWRPLAREAWAKLPAEVRAEVTRRERETAQVLSESSEARRAMSSIQQTFAPYEAMVRAEGSTMIQAMESLFRTAAALRTAPPIDRARIVASMIQGYGVDVVALDNILAGQQPQPGVGGAGGAPQQYFDPQQIVEQARQAAREEYVQARQQVVQQQASHDVETFGQGKPFFEDLREDMAVVLESAARRGVDLTLDEAYARAVAMNPEVATILRQREQAAKAAKPNGSTQRARAASTSVRSAPTGAPSNEKDPGERDLREDILAAMDEVEDR